MKSEYTYVNGTIYFLMFNCVEHFKQATELLIERGGGLNGKWFHAAMQVYLYIDCIKFDSKYVIGK